MNWPPVQRLASSASSELGLLPPPQAGKGWGGGELAHMNLVACPLALHCMPPPYPSPRKRGRECTEHAASLCFSTNEHVLFLRSRFRSLIDRSEPERFERRL